MPAKTILVTGASSVFGALTRLGALIPDDAAGVAKAITRVVDLPRGQRPFRTTIDPSRDGSEVVSAVADRIRTEFFRRIGIDDLLPSVPSL